MSIQRYPIGEHLEIAGNVQPHLQKLVYRFRIEVHNLRADESGKRDGKSENHVTFAMLLGNGKSVRVDMAPNPETNLGKMTVRYRDNIVSTKTVRLTDVNARGCVNGFDPDRQPTKDTRTSASSVDQVLSFLVAGNMHRYRFMYIDSQPLGCRYWVKSALQLLLSGGYLRADVSFAMGIEDGQSPDNLLACQWDTRFDEGRAIQMFPGILLGTRRASTIGTAEIQQKLLTATSGSLEKLAEAMDRRSEHNLNDNFKQFCGRVRASIQRNPRLDAATQQYINEQRMAYTNMFAQLANLESFEGRAAEDLAMAAGDPAAGWLFEGLNACLANRYSEAQSCLIAARQARDSDRFVNMLIAVCDMAGDED